MEIIDQTNDYFIQKKLNKNVTLRLEFYDNVIGDLPIKEYVPKNPNHKGYGHKGYKRFKLKFVLDRFKKIHGNKYSYHHVVYKNQMTPIRVICSEHGEFFITPHSHWNKVGCPKCKEK